MPRRWTGISFMDGRATYFINKHGKTLILISVYFRDPRARYATRLLTLGSTLSLDRRGKTRGAVAGELVGADSRDRQRCKAFSSTFGEKAMKIPNIMKATSQYGMVIE